MFLSLQTPILSSMPRIPHGKGLYAWRNVVAVFSFRRLFRVRAIRKVVRTNLSTCFRTVWRNMDELMKGRSSDNNGLSLNQEGKDGLPQYRARQSTLRSEKKIADLPVVTGPRLTVKYT